MPIAGFVSAGNYPRIVSVDYLVIAGGGSNGAGGFRTANGHSILEKTTYAITVGAGGTGNYDATPPTNGTNSIFDTITSTGGGSTPEGQNGYSGGSGGGAGRYGGTEPGRSGGGGIGGQGNNGGNGTNGFNGGNGGGGGGAGAAGTNATSTVTGAGGVGLASSITGTSVMYAGGGGGSGNNSTGGNAGAGGGGRGGDGGGGSVAGTANTGGGGGAAPRGSSGGSGIVIIRYADTLPAATVTGSPTITTSGGYRIYQFTGSGSINI
jgi:hypothetical protein